MIHHYRSDVGDHPNYHGMQMLILSFMCILFGMVAYLSAIFNKNLFCIFHVNKYVFLALFMIFLVLPMWLYLEKNGENIITEYNNKSSTSKFYNLSPYVFVVAWFIIIGVWLGGGAYLMSLANL
jgi:hypothetical protein